MAVTILSDCWKTMIVDWEKTSDNHKIIDNIKISDKIRGNLSNLIVVRENLY